MLSTRFKPWHLVPFAIRYAKLRATRRPVLVHFEVTMRCNARCDFCDYWKTDPTARETELKSFADAARWFRPMMISFTGGEPLLRSDLETIVAEVNRAVPLTWMSVLTHGALLTPARAQSLWDAGIAQFGVSLDFLDERHDAARGIPGLAAKILRTVPDLVARGMTVRFNTVIKRENIDEILPIVRHAAGIGAGVNLSMYTDFKNGNRAHVIRDEDLARVERLVAGLLAFKQRQRGVISNSDWYIAQMPAYLRGALRGPCRSGETTVHIDPRGMVRRCPDFPASHHWRDDRSFEPIACNACYYACRGEAQAPLTISRFRDLAAPAGGAHETGVAASA